MNAEIVAIGSELLLGETIDTNSAYLARQLASIGINLFRKTVVGDNMERIVSIIRETLDRVDLVICTGGLGPTIDDMSREAVSEALGRPLVFHQHLLDQIEERFRSFGRTMSESNRRQAYVPEGARIVENPRGTAPSFIVEDARGTVVVLPGVPHEMRYLWENAIMPYLRNDRNETGIILVRTLHATGLGESVIGEIIADLMEQENPTLGISAKQAQYELRIGAKADSPAEATAMADAMEATLRQRLGEHITGEEKLPALVARMIAAQGVTIGIHEGSSNAPVYREISATPAGRTALSGVIIHPLDRPADVAAAQALATNGAIAVRDRWRTTVGLGIQPASSPDADGFTAVCIVLAHENGQEETIGRYELSMEEAWEFVATTALDMLRQYLSKTVT